MGCGVYWQQVSEIDRAMRTMRRFGVDQLGPAYQKLFSIRGGLIKRVGFKFPREITLLTKLVGFSPGIISLWHDIESGWMSEARERPGASPVYRSVSDEVAMAILKKEVTKEIEKELMTPIEYYGE